MEWAGRREPPMKRRASQGFSSHLGSSSVASTIFILLRARNQRSVAKSLESEPLSQDLCPAELPVQCLCEVKARKYSHTPVAKAHRRGEGIGLTSCLLNVGECGFFGQKERKKDCERHSREEWVKIDNDKRFAGFTTFNMLSHACSHLPQQLCFEYALFFKEEKS